ncbi:MAG TPA: hypothetical protein VN814_04050 [Caulobacteraceae bacterium]|nr:hypothetical protein [Caulobacteraceae bacterium]
MWVWIYRVIAALLAFGGSALLSAAWEDLRGRAAELTAWLGGGLALVTIALASIMLTSAIMILISPASRPNARR